LCFAPHQVQHHINAGHPLLEGQGGVIDGLIRADFFQISMIARRRGGDDFSPKVLGDLHRHATHATRRRMDQHFLAPLHTRVLGQRLPRRQGRCRNSSGLKCAQ